MTAMNTSLCDHLVTTGGRHPQSLDTNLATTIRSLKYVGGPAGGKVGRVDVEQVDW